MNGFMVQGKIVSVSVRPQRLNYSTMRFDPERCNVRVSVRYGGEFLLFDRDCQEFVAGTQVRIAIDQGVINRA